MIRKHIVFTGQVQGVGFRWRARHAAHLYGCTGWCRNDWDGSVTMEIQGEEDAIDQHDDREREAHGGQRLFVMQLPDEKRIRHVVYEHHEHGYHRGDAVGKYRFWDRRAREYLERVLFFLLEQV